MGSLKHIKKVNLTDRLFAIFIMLIIFVLLPSPALHQLINVDIKKILIASTAIFIFYLLVKKSSVKCEPRIILLLLLLSVITGLACILSNSPSQLLLGMTLLLMISISTPVTRSAFTANSISFVYYLTVVLLVGAWIGLFYALLGGGPLLCVDNPDGKLSCLYLTTFTNTQNADYWRLIRPAGVFDEPGALSFFTILVVCLNELYGGGKSKSLILLVLGLVTLSLTHILCLVVYSALVFRKYLLFVVLATVLTVGIGTTYISKDSLVYLNLFQRFTLVEDGTLQGDNRSDQMIEFFKLVDWDISRYGDNIIVDSGGQSLSTGQSSHPFTAWFYYGFLMWIPYAVTLLVLFCHFFSRVRSVQISAVLLTLLLLQRPYIYSMYWGFAIWSVVAVMFQIKKRSNRKARSEDKTLTDTKLAHAADSL